MYADDVTLVEPVEDPVVSTMALNSDLAAIASWANQWLLHFNAAKCKSIIFSVKSKKVYHPPLFFNKKILEDLSSQHLGVTLTSNMSWTTHIKQISDTARRRIGTIRYVSHKLPRPTLEHLDQHYITLVRPILEYGCSIWGNMSRSYSHILELVQNEAARVVVGAMKTTNIHRLHTELGWPSLATRRNFLGCVLFHKVTRGKCPEHLKDIAPAPINVNIRYNLRSGANQGNTYQI